VFEVGATVAKDLVEIRPHASTNLVVDARRQTLDAATTSKAADIALGDAIEGVFGDLAATRFEALAELAGNAFAFA